MLLDRGGSGCGPPWLRLGDLALRYVNPNTKVKIELGDLTGEEKSFYQQALEQLDQSVNWLAFDEFAFGPRSPIYSQRRSHLDVAKDPLFQALLDMSMQLGVEEGLISRETGKQRIPRHRVSALTARSRNQRQPPRASRRA